MRVEMGTKSPVGRHDDPQKRPVIAYTMIPDEYTFNRAVDTEDFRKHLVNAVMHNNGITNYEGGEALLPLTHPTMGAWGNISYSPPLWAWSDDPDMQRFLSEYHQIPEGRPANYDGDYWRNVGNRKFAPGVLPISAGPQNLLTNVGCTNVAYQVGGGGTGLTGVGSAATSTTFTTGSTLVTNAWTNAILYAADTTNHQIVWGNVVSNNNTGSASVFTIDQWYNAATPGGAAATTPAAGYEWIVSWALPPAWFMGITTTNISPAATDTSMTGEATANGMGRKISTFTVTSAASGSSITWTNSAVYTYSTTGALTFYALGLFTSNVKADTTDTMFWETSFSGSFTVTNNGDQATVTDTIVAS